MGFARFAAALLAATFALAGPTLAHAVSQSPFMAEHGRTYAMPVRTIKELKRERAFRTTIHQQFDFSCGSAAVATLLTFHYNRRVDEATVFRAMFAAGEQDKIRAQGFSLLDMKRYLEASGYQADGVQVSLDELAKVGVPAIALVSDNGYRHFVVVKGMQGHRVILGDPAVGTRILERKHFETVQVGGIFFVIRSHLNVARFNAPADWQTRLVAPIELSVIRDSLGSFTLTLPDGNRF
jgi:predicted double-glycine peptidase